MRLRDLFVQSRNQQQQSTAGPVWRPPASGYVTARYGGLESHPITTAPTASRTLSALHGNAVPVAPERAARAAEAIGSGRSVSLPQGQQKATPALDAVSTGRTTPYPTSTIRTVDLLAQFPSPRAPLPVEAPALFRPASSQTGNSRYFSATSHALENVSPRPSILPARFLISPGGQEIVDIRTLSTPRCISTSSRQRAGENENTNPTFTPVTITSYGRLCPHKLASHLAKTQTQHSATPSAPLPPQLDGHGGSHSPPSIHLTNHTYSVSPSPTRHTNDTPQHQPSSLFPANQSPSHDHLHEPDGGGGGGADARLHTLTRAKGTWRTRMGRTRCWRCSLHDSRQKGWARLRRLAEWTCFCRFRAYEEESEDERERAREGEGGHEMGGLAGG
ncbi:hypothetical protein B0A55_05370 [Friedmanniomyces simplex]|uniref:Uncharacterized protein n=1 Tax=Friedmanniomyces simplex TaxID=329884 RepID=A0A4U0XLV9_9PEZI|nr:hypothetical protein B0A55_05370 [Friedmanniomyces simplex]